MYSVPQIIITIIRLWWSCLSVLSSSQWEINRKRSCCSASSTCQKTMGSIPCQVEQTKGGDFQMLTSLMLLLALLWYSWWWRRRKEQDSPTQHTHFPSIHHHPSQTQFVIAERERERQVHWRLNKDDVCIFFTMDHNNLLSYNAFCSHFQANILLHFCKSNNVVRKPNKKNYSVWDSTLSRTERIPGYCVFLCGPHSSSSPVCCDQCVGKFPVYLPLFKSFKYLQGLWYSEPFGVFSKVPPLAGSRIWK